MNCRQTSLSTGVTVERPAECATEQDSREQLGFMGSEELCPSDSGFFLSLSLSLSLSLAPLFCDSLCSPVASWWSGEAEAQFTREGSRLVLDVDS